MYFFLFFSHCRLLTFASYLFVRCMLLWLRKGALRPHSSATSSTQRWWVSRPPGLPHKSTKWGESIMSSFSPTATAATHGVLNLLAAQVVVHWRHLPLAALGARLGPHWRAQVGIRGDVHVEGSDLGPIHVIPECQTLDSGTCLAGALQASFVVVAARDGSLNVDVIPIWN